MLVDPLIIILIGVVVIAIASAISPKLGIAGPLLLVAIGAGVSLLPFVSVPKINPEIILIGVLPPLLYSSAVSLPAIEFRRDFRPIAGLSVLLVLISSIVLGAFFFFAIPDLGLALALGLGAILSPTDAVATTIAKRLGISPRVITMVEGESLLNDATALVLLRTAVAAFVAGTVSWGEAVGTFVWGVLIAIVVGALIGYLNLVVRERVSHSAANTALSFVVPFVAYLPTEQLGGSGLVAAVVAGIVTGQGAARRFTPEQRLSDELNWRTIELMLEGAVFLVMGLELKDIVVANVRDHEGIGHAGWLALTALAIVLVVRAAYVSGLLWRQSRRARQSQQRERLTAFQDRLDAGPVQPENRAAPRRGRFRSPDPERQAHGLARGRTRVSRALADLDYYQTAPLGWRHGMIIVWAGMRGVVTLAAAQTLPSDTPQRPLIVFVAFLVAVGSLLLQGLSLPWLARRLGLVGSGRGGLSADEQHALDEELRAAAAKALNEQHITRRNGSEFPAGFVQKVGDRFTSPPDDEMTETARDMIELRLAMIGAMRGRLNELSSDGAFSTAALRHALAELDADEISIQLRLDDED